MRMNRRNVLVGLGTIVAGGGAALGTGAFSSVEASRDVTIDTNADADAYLSLTPANGAEAYVTEGEVLEVEINRLNQEATTRINDLIEINLNADNVTINSINVTVEGTATAPLTILDEDIDETDLPTTFGLEIDFDTYTLEDISDDVTIRIVADAEPESA